MGQQDLTQSNSLSGPEPQHLPHVLDISSWQPPSMINWETVAQDKSLQACYVKASEGTTYQNPHRVSQGAGARANGIEVGFYHYARPSWGSAQEQADHFLRSQPKSVQLRPMLDLEWLESIKGPPLVRWITNFCERIHARIGVRPLLYTYPAWWEQWVVSAGGLHAPAVAYLENRLLWIAHYGVESPRVPPPWDSWALWQYTSQRTVRGIQDPTVDDSHLALRVSQIRLSLVQRARARRASRT